jgi:hypothetical protein
MVGNAVDGDVVAEVAQRVAVRWERQAAHPRPNPVRADHQVERPGPAAREGRLDAASGLPHCLDRVVEAVFDAIGCGVEQQAVEVAAEQFGVAVDASAERVAVHAGDPPAGRVDDGAAAHVGAQPADLRQQAHALRNGQRGPADVHLVAAGAHGTRALDDRGPRAVAAQPVRECGAGDAAARDQNPCAIHGQEWYIRLRRLCKTFVPGRCVNRRTATVGPCGSSSWRRR